MATPLVPVAPRMGTVIQIGGIRRTTSSISSSPPRGIRPGRSAGTLRRPGSSEPPFSTTALSTLPAFSPGTGTCCGCAGRPAAHVLHRTRGRSRASPSSWERPWWRRCCWPPRRRVGAAIGVGSGRQPAAWCCSEFVARAILPTKCGQMGCRSGQCRLMVGAAISFVVGLILSYFGGRRQLRLRSKAEAQAILSRP